MLCMSDLLQRTKAILGMNCLALKVKHGLTEKQVEKRTGVAQKTFNNIVQGEHNPTIKSIVGLAEAFKVEPWELLREDFAGKHLTAEDWVALSAEVVKLRNSEARDVAEELAGYSSSPRSSS